MINENISTNKIREFIYYMETKSQNIIDSKEEPYLMGCHFDTAYYFYYKKENITTLSMEFLYTIKTKSENYVIYADICVLSEAELEKYHIIFKKIPRDILKV